MTTRAAVTGGRPATMTRSAVQQARTRPSTPTQGGVALDTGLPPTGEGWVSVDNHRRKHKPASAPAPVPGASSSSSSSSTGLAIPSAVAAGSSSGGNGRRDPRRTQSAIDATSDKSEKEKEEKEEPPVARPNARADALSAAVTMDKKARERSYYSGGASAVGSPPAAMGLSVSATSWGSPPPAQPPRHMGRSNSASPDAAAAAFQLEKSLERGSSLQKLMTAWQVIEAGKEQQPPANARPATRTAKTTRSTANNERSESVSSLFSLDILGETALAPPVSMPLRRAQSETATNSNRQSRSPSGRSNAVAAVDGNASPANAAATATGANNGAGNGTSNKKCGDKRDFFFRNLDFETRCLLQIDDVAAFSVTDFEMARKISNAIVDLFPELKDRQAFDADADAFYFSGESRKFPLVVTDATACVGGNVLSFCDYFHYVYAIENDATRVSMLENNLRVLNKFNVSCRCASYLDVMYEYDQDVVFFDPPWGGPEYKDQEKVDLYLDEQPLYEICEQLQGYAKCIVLKVPTNFDDEKFAYCVSGKVTVRKDFKKMHLVVLDFR